MSKQAKSKEVDLLEDTLRDVAKGGAGSGTVTGTERMRAALALIVLKAVQDRQSQKGKEVTEGELQLIVHLVNGSQALPKKKKWWKELLDVVVSIFK